MIDWLVRGPGAAARQAAALRQEGVTVTAGPLGEFSVDFGTHGWFPRVLPNEAGEDDSPEEENGDES